MKYSIAFFVTFFALNLYGQNHKTETLTIKRYYENGKIVKVDTLWEEENTFEDTIKMEKWPFVYHNNDSLFNAFTHDDFSFHWPDFDFPKHDEIDSIMENHFKMIQEKSKRFEEHFKEHFDKHQFQWHLQDSMLRKKLNNLKRKHFEIKEKQIRLKQNKAV